MTRTCVCILIFSCRFLFCPEILYQTDASS